MLDEALGDLAGSVQIVSFNDDGPHGVADRHAAVGRAATA